MRRDGRSVLVVEDDSLNRVVLSKLPEHDGYQARTAVDGLVTLAILDDETFDTLLLDIVMPKIDGLEVLRRIKADPRWWHIPVIVISAVDDKDSIVACLELGADDDGQEPCKAGVVEPSSVARSGSDRAAARHPPYRRRGVVSG